MMSTPTLPIAGPAAGPVSTTLWRRVARRLAPVTGLWREAWLYLVGSEHSGFRQIECLHTLDDRLLEDIGVGRRQPQAQHPDFDAIRRKPIAFTQPW